MDYKVILEAWLGYFSLSSFLGEEEEKVQKCIIVVLCGSYYITSGHTVICLYFGDTQTDQWALCGEGEMIPQMVLFSTAGHSSVTEFLTVMKFFSSCTNVYNSLIH